MGRTRAAGFGLALCVIGSRAANVANTVASKDSPTEKVVALMEDLKAKVQKEGDYEAGTYNEFACFCKDGMADKSEAITTGSDSKDSLQAQIQASMQRRKDADAGVQEAVEGIATLEKEIQTLSAEHKEEALQSERDELDLTNAVQALEAAIRELKAAKIATSFLQINPLAKQVRHAILMAQMLDLPHTREKKAASLVQAISRAGEGDIPSEVYEFHSSDIIDTLEGLMKDFKDKRVEVQEAAVESKKVYDGLLQEKSNAIELHQTTIKDSKVKKATEQKEIATASADLSAVSAKLLDDQEYLTELSAQCHEKAVIWNQRTDMRARELNALNSATEMIKSLEKDEGKADKSELLQKAPALVQVAAHNADGHRIIPSRFLRAAELQRLSMAERRPEPRQAARQRDDPRTAEALSLLRSRAGSLKSVELLKLASTAGDDPLAKVKVMIQALIERLIKEAASEANHKGWCDKEVGVATQKRDYAAKEIKEINSFLSGSEVRREKLREQEETLTAEMEALQKDHDHYAAIRAFEKVEAEMAISSSQNSSKVVEEAMEMLDKFYKEAAKEDKSDLSLLQTRRSVNSTRGPTVEEEIPDAGFDDVYTGEQGSSTGVMAMLEVIKSDFDRTASETEKAEKEAEQEWLAMQTDIGKSNATKSETRKSIRSQLSEADSDDGQARDDLVAEQEKMDKALGQLAALGPSCLESGAETAEERKIKRDEEIEALNQALCILDNHEAGGALAC